MNLPNYLRRGAVLFAAALLPLSLSAQKPSTATADEIAHLVDSHYNQLHSLRAGFTQTYQGLGINRSESGTLLLLKPGRMRWDYSSPAGKIFLLDGKYAWSYAPGADQVQRILAKQLDDLRSPLSFLLGHTQLEKELTDLRLSTAPDGHFLLSGTPKGQQERVRQIRLAVTAAGAITAIEIEETDGALTRFTFTGEQPNAPVPDGAFHFVPPTGIPVVDGLPPV
jgi:outer membrane lipoprotein carrier protein